MRCAERRYSDRSLHCDEGYFLVVQVLCEEGASRQASRDEHDNEYI